MHDWISKPFPRLLPPTEPPSVKRVKVDIGLEVLWKWFGSGWGSGWGS
jgi:hypothetical protein